MPFTSSKPIVRTITSNQHTLLETFSLVCKLKGLPTSAQLLADAPANLTEQLKARQAFSFTDRDLQLTDPLAALIYLDRRYPAPALSPIDAQDTAAMHSALADVLRPRNLKQAANSLNVLPGLLRGGRYLLGSDASLLDCAVVGLYECIAGAQPERLTSATHAALSPLQMQLQLLVTAQGSA